MPREKRRDARVLRHAGNGLGVQVEDLVAAQAGAHQPGPAVAGELAGEELPLAAQFFAPRVDVVHELVDEGDGDLLDLALGIGHLAHEDVAGGVDATFGVGVQNGGSPWNLLVLQRLVQVLFRRRTGSAIRSP